MKKVIRKKKKVLNLTYNSNVYSIAFSFCDSRSALCIHPVFDTELLKDISQLSRFNIINKFYFLIKNTFKWTLLNSLQVGDSEKYNEVHCGLKDPWKLLGGSPGVYGSHVESSCI